MVHWCGFLLVAVWYKTLRVSLSLSVSFYLWQEQFHFQKLAFNCTCDSEKQDDPFLDCWSMHSACVVLSSVCVVFSFLCLVSASYFSLVFPSFSINQLAQQATLLSSWLYCTLLPDYTPNFELWMDLLLKKRTWDNSWSIEYGWYESVAPAA